MLIFLHDVHECLSFRNIKKKSAKFILDFYLLAFVCQKLGFRAFLPAASGSGGEQLSPI
jgi:hypothetical protein